LDGKEFFTSFFTKERKNEEKMGWEGRENGPNERIRRKEEKRKIDRQVVNTTLTLYTRPG
jgi:hypothetical protein